MSDTKKHVTMWSLRGTDACAKRRNSLFKGLNSGKKELHIIRAGLNRKTAIELDKALFEALKTRPVTMEEIRELNDKVSEIKDEARAGLCEAYKELPCKTTKQRDALLNVAWSRIDRFARADSKRKHNWDIIQNDPRDLDIGSDIVVDGVCPHFLDVYDAPLDENKQPVAEFTLEGVMLNDGKPKITQEQAYGSLQLWAILNYLRSKVQPGHKAYLKASIYYLGKANDSFGAKPHFDEDYFETRGGKNIITLEEVYDSTMDPETTDCNALFDPKVAEFAEGIPEEECSKEDCETCDLFDICKFVNPPMPMETASVRKSISDLSGLTPAQLKVVNFDRGVLRDIAGPGSGKTLVLTLRYVTLLNKGVRPDEILAITFTNAAAEEMKSRIKLYNLDLGTGEDFADDVLHIMTFNAFGDMILGYEEVYESLGFSQKPSVIDDNDRSSIIAKLLAAHPVDGLDEINFTANTMNCKGALAIARRVFDIVKQGELGVPYGVDDVETVYDKLGWDRKFVKNGLETVRQLIRLYDLYDEKLRRDNLIEFADQEVLLFEVLRKDPTFLNRFGFRHIIVDEFQDTSSGQLELLRKLMEDPKNESTMVVGDINQAIYGFRGTGPNFLRDFGELLDVEVTDIPLLENFRSQENIVEFANALIQKAAYGFENELIATRPAGKPVIVNGFLTKEEEAEYVVNGIKKHLEEGVNPEDIAIIAYTKYELMKMADLLTREGIPSILMNPELLVENSRVRAAIAMMAAFTDESDRKDLLTYANARVGGNILSMDETEAELAIAEAEAELAEVRKLNGEKKREEIYRLLEDIDDVEDEVYESFIETLKRKRSVSQIEEYCSDFYDYGQQAAFRRTHNYPGVVLTTAHSSKGLEWPVVYNMISGYHKPANTDGKEERDMSKDEVEERRRLFFVSVTRARDELYVTAQYTAFGKKNKYTYNRYLLEAMDCVGMVFDAATVENQRELRAKARKEELKELKKTSEPTAKDLVKGSTKAIKDAPKKIAKKEAKDAGKEAADAEERSQDETDEPVEQAV